MEGKIHPQCTDVIFAILCIVITQLFVSSFYPSVFGACTLCADISRQKNTIKIFDLKKYQIGDSWSCESSLITATPKNLGKCGFFWNFFDWWWVHILMPGNEEFHFRRLLHVKTKVTRWWRSPHQGKFKKSWSAPMP